MTSNAIARRLDAISSKGAMRSADIANVLESLPRDDRSRLWDAVNPDLDGDVLLYVNDEVRTGLIRHMDNAELVAATEGLDTDDLADDLANAPGTALAINGTTFDYTFAPYSLTLLQLQVNGAEPGDPTATPTATPTRTAGAEQGDAGAYRRDVRQARRIDRHSRGTARAPLQILESPQVSRPYRCIGRIRLLGSLRGWSCTLLHPSRRMPPPIS